MRDRIADRPDAPPSLDEVAALMGMGRTGAWRRFRRETGATPHAYAMQLRLRLARCALSAEESAAEVVAARGPDRHAEIGDDTEVLDGEIVADQRVLARHAAIEACATSSRRLPVRPG